LKLHGSSYYSILRQICVCVYGVCASLLSAYIAAIALVSPSNKPNILPAHFCLKYTV
jgi:hypothetical protein